MSKKEKIVCFLFFVCVLLFVCGSYTEYVHAHTPHTVIHRDGRVWHLVRAPQGHGFLNGRLLQLGSDRTIAFLDESGFVLRFNVGDVKVICGE